MMKYAQQALQCHRRRTVGTAGQVHRLTILKRQFKNVPSDFGGGGGVILLSVRAGLNGRTAMKAIGEEDQELVERDEGGEGIQRKT